MFFHVDTPLNRVQYSTVLYSHTVVVSYSYVLILHYHMSRIAPMATPAPSRCSCCYMRSESRTGPTGHGDGNFLVLLLRNAVQCITSTKRDREAKKNC